MLKQKKIYIVPIFGFLLTILITAIIFELPFCKTRPIAYIDSLYEATSLVTATGSNVVNISEDFTFIGQLMMLFAMQIGAIGFMLFFSILFSFSKRKIKLSDAIFLSNEINTNNYTTVRFQAKRITKYTIVIEILGAWLLSFKFIPMFGIKTGIWYSIFHSVSAFCNVGAEIIKNTGFCIFRNDLYINIIFIILMFLGSLGFFVLEDLVHWFCCGKKNKITIQSKLVLNVSFLIVIIGTLLIKIFDPQISILDSAFTITSARNTGFLTYMTSTLNEITKLIITIIMFIGGGPGSNAGGIRVMVLVVLFFTTWANIQEREDVVVYYRSINEKTIKKAVSVLNIDLLIVFLGLLSLVLTEKQGVIDTLFYSVSEFSNTGLTTLNMSELSSMGKFISMVLMFAGRIAPFSFTSLFVPMDRKNSGIKYPNIDVIL